MKPLHLAATVALLSVVAFAIVLLTRSDAAPAPAQIKDETFINVDHPGVRGFENGDCFRDPAINAAEEEPILNTVQCVGAQNEVFSFITLDEGPWDVARVTAETREKCGEAFRQVWGEKSRYRFYGAMPSQRSWERESDRNSMCVVYLPGSTFEIDPIEEAAAG